MFPEVLNDIPQELYCRRYAPLWSLAMSRPLTYAQYKVATDVSEFDALQATRPPIQNEETIPKPLRFACVVLSSLNLSPLCNNARAAASVVALQFQR